MVQLMWKIVWQFFNMLNIELQYDPAIQLRGIYPKEMKTYVEAEICTQMFILALFTTAKR